MDINKLYNNLCIINAIYHIAVLISIFGFQISSMHHFIIISAFGIVINLYFLFGFSKQTNILNEQPINPKQNDIQNNQQNNIQNEIQQNNIQNEQPINQKAITISLKPQTKFYPIVHPQNELGPIESKHNTLKDDCVIFKINPKSITIKKGTPYVKEYETFTSSNKALHDEYYCLALGTQITLPKGTIFNNGVDTIKLKSDTLVTVA